ncbi:unnamed protein product [Eruca vesicaria subsp. sativa]|uniref:Uncharacterized protein n=1 Tax=Eruca vesicaria subsp. sativa TaxID=29727 RepID=A0ABC8L8Q0_ERUVS|nr:unnamed protein product [Eruca vesicaria subsp. sativa]
MKSWKIETSGVLSLDGPVLVQDLLLLYKGNTVAWHNLLFAVRNYPEPLSFNSVDLLQLQKKKGLKTECHRIRSHLIDTFWSSAGTSDSAPEKILQISRTVNQKLIHGPSAAVTGPKWLLFPRELKPVPIGVV